MNTERKESGKARYAIVGLSALVLLALGTTAYQEGANHEAVGAMNSSRLEAERLLGEKLQLEKSIAALNSDLAGGTRSLAAAEQREAELRRRLEASLRHADGLQAAARKSNKLAREVADLKVLKQQLEQQLDAERNIAAEVKARLERALEERDGLAMELQQQRDGAHMVNNAVVEALRGRKQRLTVVARRTKEIRMAFDLPEALAKGASFRISAPGGRTYSGADPAVSIVAGEREAEATASVVGMVGPKERAARVHLKFKPDNKLEAGTYRIDVMSDGAYLNTVLLNLR